MKFLQKVFANLSALGDNASLIFFALGVVSLGLADWDTLVMLARWTGFAFIVAGATIWISRITFGEIKLEELIKEVMLNNVAAAIVVASLLVFCAVVFLGLLTWAK